MSDLRFGGRRFVLFAGDVYYPLGGWEDFRGDFDTLDEAKAAHEVRPYAWAHILDVAEGLIVAHQWEDSNWADGAPQS